MLFGLLALGNPFVRYEKVKRRIDLRKGKVVKINGVEVKVIQ